MENINRKYFEAYNNIEVHKLMLQDVSRVKTYESAFLENKELFFNKVVLDVGCGTGILSLFAVKAGALKVYAVEASNICHLAKEIITANNMHHIITVFCDCIEEVILPEKVDIIISEWMGFYLIHESMLNSVLFARDKFLKDDGLLFPDVCELWACPCNLNKFFKENIEFWYDVYGFSMAPLGKAVYEEACSKPLVTEISSEDLLSVPICIKRIVLKSISISELKKFNIRCFVSFIKDSSCQGISLWFHCFFPSMAASEPKVLSTSPMASKTHWKQTIILIPEVNCEKGDIFGWDITFEQDFENPRIYNIICEILPDDIEHPIPCNCGLMKCLIISKMINKISENK